LLYFAFCVIVNIYYNHHHHSHFFFVFSTKKNYERDLHFLKLRERESARARALHKERTHREIYIRYIRVKRGDYLKAQEEEEEEE